MNSIVSKEIILEGYYRDIIEVMFYKQGDTDHDLIGKLRGPNENIQIWDRIRVDGGSATAYGKELCTWEGCELEMPKMERALLLRGDKVYNQPKSEWWKSCAFLVAFSAFTLVEKIIKPIFVQTPLKIVSTLGGRCELARDAKWPGLMPLRALVGLVVHPILAALGLLPEGSNYFNKLNGDLERWINGHTDLDLETKSSAQRQYEAPYLAPCEQPLFKFKSPIRSNKVGVSKLTGEEQKLAFRALMGCTFGSARPQVQMQLGHFAD